MFDNVKFIEFPGEFSPEFSTISPAPVFKKSFKLRSNVLSAKAFLCAPSLAVVYINGYPLTDNLLLSPTSDYTKTLWYTTHDATNLLKTGVNEIAVILGNGFYNESLKTPWNYDIAPWRAKSKFAFSLEIKTIDENMLIETDDNWVVSKELSPVTFNQLRCGEHYDFRKGEKWLDIGNLASFEEKAAISEKPLGKLRECQCEPIKEFESYKPIRVFKNAKNNLIYDFGQNLSGWEEITFEGKRGTEVIIRHSENIFPDGTLQLKNMDAKHFYANCEFETNRIILSGEKETYKPRFAYFGFRYLEIEGIEEENITNICSIFVHQDVKKTTDFECSNELFNTLFKLSGYSTLSNLFYMPTDCPTREKLGWTNDAASSAEQLLISYDTYDLFKKWLQDIYDSQRESGALPGIIPTSGWGYPFEEYNGPICGAVLLELPLRMYNLKGDKEIIKTSFPYILKYIDFLDNSKDEDGFLSVGLWDWLGPFPKNNLPTPLSFSSTALLLRFYELALDFADIIDYDKSGLQERKTALYNHFFGKYYDEEADRCTVDSQTAISMMISLKDDGATDGLLKQLLNKIAEKDYHHNCGMLGLQFLYRVLHKYGHDDVAYKIINAKGYPSYRDWIEDGATTLYEAWTPAGSNNHHMNSHFLMWFYEAILGISRKEHCICYKNIDIKPFFPDDMDYAKGYIDAPCGKISCEWSRDNNTVIYKYSIPSSVDYDIVPPKGYVLESNESDTLIFKRI